MTSDANVGGGLAVNSSRRAWFSDSTRSSAGRACLASIRPKAGSVSNSRSGLFTPTILSDVQQHPGESGGAADEAAEAGQGAVSESPRERPGVAGCQQERAAVPRIRQDIHGRRPRVRGAVFEDFAGGGRGGRLPFRRAQGAVVVGVEAGE